MKKTNVITLDKVFEVVWEKEEKRAIQSPSLDASYTTNNYKVDENRLFEEIVFALWDGWDIQMEMPS